MSPAQARKICELVGEYLSEPSGTERSLRSSPGLSSELYWMHAWEAAVIGVEYAMSVDDP
jgi:hypothetical protein